jgi:nicotinamidase-related amidase
VKLDPHSTVVLTLDLQHGILDMVEGSRACLPNAARVVAAARSAKLPVMHVGLGFSPGHPEVSPRNSRFSQLATAGRFVDGSDETKIHEDVFREGDTVIKKRRVSGFAGSTLEMVLRSREAKTLVLFGVATSGIVLSTVRQAADLDYELIVVADASWDRDEEVHRVLTTKVFPGQAKVVSTEDFVSGSGR